MATKIKYYQLDLAGQVLATDLNAAFYSNISLADGTHKPSADWDFNAKKITNLATPTNASDAATKGYVDAVKQALDIKDSVRVATTANITLSGTQTIDGIVLVAGDRVLVKDQTTGSQNGLYNVSAGTWTRTVDADVDTEVTLGMYTYVELGTLNGAAGFVLSSATANPIVVGTAGLTFTQFSGAGQINAGGGMTKNGNTLDVVGTAGRIVVNADNVDLATTAVGAGSYGSASQVATFTVDAYGRLTAAGNTSITPGAIGAESAIAAGTTAQYWRGDKSWQALNTTAVVEGTNLYFTAARVMSSVISAFTVGANTSVTNADTVETAIEKLQGQVNARISGNQTITLSGDVVGSGSTAITTTIANAAVTYAKIQNVSAPGKMLGRYSTGAGSVQELSFGTGFTVDGTTGVITYSEQFRGTVTNVALTQPAAGFSITSSNTSSNASFTFALTNDLAALEGLAGTGLAVRTGVDAWAQRSIAGTASQIVVANGDGVAGNPTISLATVGTAGTYIKTTTDAYGRVTAGASLALADLPSGVQLSGNFISKEVITVSSGVLTYTLANTPVAGTEHLYVNGTLQKSGAGNDYTITGNQVTFIYQPLVNDTVQITYYK